jgi:exopolysaccharide biosynthesis polyprenyl glycosylphosphotransferase
MLKDQDKFFNKVALGVDALVIGISFAIAFAIRDYLDIGFLHPLPPLAEYLPVLALVSLLWILFLNMFGVYGSMREKGFGQVFWMVYEASMAAILTFSAVAFLSGMDFLSRTFVLILFGSATVLLTAEKWLVLLSLRSVRRQGFNYRVLLVVGSGTRAARFARTVESHPEWGMKILGFIDEQEMQGMAVGKGRVIGSFDDLSRVLDENVVDEVLFIMPRKWLARLEEYVKICENIGVKATIAVDFFDTAIAKPVLKNMEGWPMLTFDSTPNDFLLLNFKRLFDFASSAVGLLLLSPLFLVIALIIKTTSPGPVFFRQTRCGVNGRTFKILKFRTMGVDAEKKLAGLQKLNELRGPAFKIQNDPRVTPIGRFLRKTSLDELPQLLNVLMGDMALVGPRPPIPSEVERYERWQRRRLSMRPGITCIHEVVARNDKDFHNWMKLDLEYIDNWCLNLDLKILLKTVLAVVRGTGC